MEKSRFSWRKRIASFKYAFNGIGLLFRNEHNAWIHAAFTVGVTIAGFGFGLSATEWIAVAFAIGSVLAGSRLLAAEAFNSAIEALADHVSPERHEQIKRTKDLAAGAVLLTAIAAATVGLIIFVPKFIGLL